MYGKALDGVTELEYTSGVPFPSDKYYDLYTSTSQNTACNGSKCGGDGTTETLGWYGDYAAFVWSGTPWFSRGGGQTYAAGAGAFSFSASGGQAGGSDSFRVVLSAN